MALSKRVMGGSTSVSVPALKSLIFAVSHHAREATRASAFKWQSRSRRKVRGVPVSACCLSPQASRIQQHRDKIQVHTPGCAKLMSQFSAPAGKRSVMDLTFSNRSC